MIFTKAFELLADIHFRFVAKLQLYRKSFFIFKLLFAGYSASALLAIIFAIPFGLRLLGHHDSGRWQHFGEAFYTAYFELFLGNACLGKTLFVTVYHSVNQWDLNHKSFMKENYLITLINGFSFIRGRRFNAPGVNNWKIRQCLSPVSHATSIRAAQVNLVARYNNRRCHVYQVILTFVITEWLSFSSPCSPSPYTCRVYFDTKLLSVSYMPMDQLLIISVIIRNFYRQCSIR